MSEDIIDGHSFFRVFFKHAFKQVLEIFTNCLPLLVNKLKFRFLDFISVVLDVFLREFVLWNRERKHARHERINQYAKGPYIDRKRIMLQFECLWSYVLHCPTQSGASFVLIERFGVLKVCEDWLGNLTDIFEQDVLGFDIAVHDVSLMQI